MSARTFAPPAAAPVRRRPPGRDGPRLGPLTGGTRTGEERAGKGHKDDGTGVSHVGPEGDATRPAFPGTEVPPGRDRGPGGGRTRALERGGIGQGRSTESMTWITPLEAKTSAWATVASSTMTV